ncbi:hypothetical protein A0J61_06218, partial [Choanephora cucurbitarum]
LQAAEGAEEQDNVVLEVCAEILSCLARKAKRWSKTNLGETTFIHDQLTDILDCTFGSLNADLFHYEIQDKWMSKASLKPDYLLSMNTCQSKPLDLYVMEAKTPEAHKGDMDFVKMSIMLKHMLDKIVLHGCHVFQYTMTLLFNGIYLMKEVSIGSLPSSPQEIDCLVPRYLKIMDITLLIVLNTI